MLLQIKCIYIYKQIKQLEDFLTNFKNMSNEIRVTSQVLFGKILKHDALLQLIKQFHCLNSTIA